MDGRGGGGGTDSEELVGKPAYIRLARRATQSAAMSERSFFSLPERSSQRALEPDAMAGVVQGGDGGRRCGGVLARRLAMLK